MENLSKTSETVYNVAVAAIAVLVLSTVVKSTVEAFKKVKK